jgi:hypothetical protein
MSLAIDLKSKLFITSSTIKPLDMSFIHQSFISKGLGFAFEACYSHIAEIISNIYEHSPPDSQSSVCWHIEAEQSGDSIIIEITDLGIGIFNSINRKHKTKLSPLESFNYEINTRAQPGRGYGLQTIISGVKAGDLQHFKVSSSGVALTHSESVSASRSTITSGTKISLAVAIGASQ